MRTREIATRIVIGLAITALARPVLGEDTSAWNQLQFLVGTWTAGGPNELGTAAGTTTFSVELKGSVIVRRSFADYKTGPQAGTRHEDLMIIYRDAVDAPPRAVYFDSEGHVIRYAVTVHRDNEAVFESAPSEPGPRYRLEYQRAGRSLTGRFLIAAPGADYQTYLSWTSTQQ